MPGSNSPEPHDASEPHGELPAGGSSGAAPASGQGGMEATEPPDLRVIARGTRYPLAAFEFVLRGLEFTAQRVHGERRKKPAKGKPDAPSDRHVTGQQLCAGLRDFANEQYGLLARYLLGRWNICRTEDFGQIVFAMVDAGALGRRPEDNIHDFDSVFEFDEAFGALTPVNLPRK